MQSRQRLQGGQLQRSIDPRTGGWFGEHSPQLGQSGLRPGPQPRADFQRIQPGGIIPRRQQRTQAGQGGVRGGPERLQQPQLLPQRGVVPGDTGRQDAHHFFGLCGIESRQCGGLVGTGNIAQQPPPQQRRGARGVAPQLVNQPGGGDGVETQVGMQVPLDVGQNGRGGGAQPTERLQPRRLGGGRAHPQQPREQRGGLGGPGPPRLDLPESQPPQVRPLLGQCRQQVVEFDRVVPDQQLKGLGPQQVVQPGIAQPATQRRLRLFVERGFKPASGQPQQVGRRVFRRALFQRRDDRWVEYAVECQFEFIRGGPVEATGGETAQRERRIAEQAGQAGEQFGLLLGQGEQRGECLFADRDVVGVETGEQFRAEGLGGGAHAGGGRRGVGLPAGLLREQAGPQHGDRRFPQVDPFVNDQQSPAEGRVGHLVGALLLPLVTTQGHSSPGQCHQGQQPGPARAEPPQPRRA